MEHPPIKATITVSGTGTVSVQPDTARLNLGILATDKTSTEAQRQVAVDMSSLLGILKESGVHDKDIKTANINIRPVAEYDRDHNYVGVSGYEVSSSLTVIVRDLESVGKILDSAVAHGANTVHGVDFYIDDPIPAASEARKLAVKHARASADQLAEAAGLFVTGVFAISEGYAPSPRALEYGGGNVRMMASSADASMPISSGEIDVSVQIQAVFEIVPIGE